MVPLVVPDMPLHVRQEQETQAKPPRLVDICQTHQQVGDHLVLIVALQAVGETGIADAKRTTGQRDAAPWQSSRTGIPLLALRSTPMIPWTPAKPRQVDAEIQA